METENLFVFQKINENKAKLFSLFLKIMKTRKRCFYSLPLTPPPTLPPPQPPFPPPPAPPPPPPPPPFFKIVFKKK